MFIYSRGIFKGHSSFQIKFIFYMTMVYLILPCSLCFHCPWFCPVCFKHLAVSAYLKLRRDMIWRYTDSIVFMLVTYVGRQPMMCIKKAELRPYNMQDLAKVQKRDRTEYLQWIIWAHLSLYREAYLHTISYGIPIFLSIKQPFYSHSFILS